MLLLFSRVKDSTGGEFGGGAHAMRANLRCCSRNFSEPASCSPVAHEPKSSTVHPAQRDCASAASLDQAPPQPASSSWSPLEVQVLATAAVVLFLFLVFTVLRCWLRRQQSELDRVVHQYLKDKNYHVR